MKCPNCQTPLKTNDYEGISIETCSQCNGEWLDSDELGKVVAIREARFNSDEKRAISESTTIKGVVLEDIDRDLKCPKCDGITDALNYGGDSGIIIDRCTVCHGLWLDDRELEKIQMLIEGWDDALPADLEKYGPKLRDVAAELEEADDVAVSRIPFIGKFINSAINGIPDIVN
jgi:Zn-finger nucleic acid-binding protein